MKLQPEILLNSNALRRLFFGSLLVVLAIFLAFSVFYLVSGYDGLKNWYTSMNGCFYKYPYWTTDFFTPAVKSTGNLFAAIAAAVSATGIIYILARRKKYFSYRAAAQPTSDGPPVWGWYVVIALLAAGVWYYSKGLAKPSADEIFSGVNCAELPPFQVLAYYMLPNNHIYFNFFNGYFSRWTNIDVVQAGRIISLLAYIGALSCLFYWFSKLLRNRLFAFIALIPVSLQFTTWALSFQARGYESQLFFGWMAIIALFRYIETCNARFLLINAFFCIFGFGFVPTFLYYFAAQTAFLGLYQLYKRSIDVKIIKYACITVAGIFLLYLPALCFSGSAALGGNVYVKTQHLGLSAFLPRFTEACKTLSFLQFSALTKEDGPVNLLLMLVPLLLFVFRRKDYNLVASFYVVLWTVWVVVCCYMERYPFSRNMILHYCFTLTAIIYTLFAIAEALFRKVANAAIKNTIISVFCGLPLLALSVHFFMWGKINAPFFLYFMDVNYMYEDYMADINTIPPGSKVTFSDERYCFYYYCRKGPYQTVRCPAGDEEYFVKASGEPLPQNIAAHYTLVRAGKGGSEIYKKK